VDGIATGSGKGWLMILDVTTGKVLKKLDTPMPTGVDPLLTPAGLARITGITLDPATDPKITYIYAGDLLGRMWRFDLTVKGVISVIKLGDAGALQPITTRPDATMCSVVTTAADKTTTTANKVVVAFATGKLLDVADISNKDVQSLYVMRDSNVDIGTGTFPGTNMAQRKLTKTTSSGGDVYKVSGTTVDLSTQIGWYVNFINDRERVTVDPKIVTGALNMVSNIPDASAACTVGGKSNLYQFDVCAGSGDGDGEVGATLSSTSATVGFLVGNLPSGAKKIISTQADGGIVTVPAGDLRAPVLRRAGWRRIRN
jgi:type IV pilus assembly protein PilY1